MWLIKSTSLNSNGYPQKNSYLQGVDKSRFAKYILGTSHDTIALPVSLYLPQDAQTCKKVIFSIHGIKRNAKKYRNIFVPYVQDKNVLIAAPSFTHEFYKSSLSLNLGNLLHSTKDAEFLPEEDWTFTHLYKLFLLLKNEFPALETFSLFGHSAGAQFVHRMVLFTDYAEMDAAVAANAGWYTVLDDSRAFPYGIEKVLDHEQVGAALKRKLMIVVGGEDSIQDDNLRRSNKARQQGENRLERAKYAFSVAENCARRAHREFNWEHKVIPGVAHSSRSIIPSIIDYLL